MQTVNQIPRVIHYCWFGRNPLPESAQRCIESWKKFCPDFEIRCWDETNYDVNACAYTKEAYEAGKWAFVSDYARFDILHKHGGVYFDTDVEMIAPIEDILEKGSFMGVEQSNSGGMVAPGLGMASVPGHPVYERMLAAYRNMHFLNPDGTYNQTTVVKYTTDILLEYGLEKTNEPQCVAGIWIYPWDYFCPIEYETGKKTITPRTRTIHHYSASWFSKEEQSIHRFAVKAMKLFGKKMGGCMGSIYGLPYRLKNRIRRMGLWKTVKFACRKLLHRKRAM